MNDGSNSYFFERPMLVVDHATSTITECNAGAETMLGRSNGELVGKEFSQLFTRATRETISKNYPKELSEKEIWTVENGTSRLFVQLATQLIRVKGRPAKLLIIHDVTELVTNRETDSYKYPVLEFCPNHTPLAEIEWHPDLYITRWSSSAEQLLGWTGEESEHSEEFVQNFFHKADFQQFRRQIDAALQDGSTYLESTMRCYNKESHTLHCDWYNTLLMDEAGDLIAIRSLVHNVTKRRESDVMFRALSEESLVGVYLIQDGIFKYINPRFAKIFHYEVDEIINKLGPLDLAHPDDSPLVSENLKKRVSGKQKSIEYDFRGVTKDDQVIYVNVYGTRINYLGKPAVIGTLVDITDNKLMMKQYQASLRSFQDLFDSISDAIYIQNKDGKFLEVNKGAVGMYGYDREFFIGKTPEVLAAPGKVNMQKTQEKFDLALNGEVQHLDWWGKRKNGEIFPKEIVMNPGTYFGEEVVIAIARDITDRYEAEEDLRKNEELFRQLFQNAPIAISMLDEHQEIKFVNNSFEETFGYNSEEIRGLDIDSIIVPKHLTEEARTMSNKIFDGSAAGIISKRKRKDGSLVDVMIYGVPVTVNNRTIAIFGIYVDITKRRKAEERVRKSLREKEVLLAEIHHRVKNNLAVITGLLELQAHNAESDNARQVLNESQMRINSIALIHEKLYQSEDLSKINFDTYIRELVDIIVSSLIKSEKEVDLRFDTDSIDLTINQAIPCGLILNELITNSYKHAFENRTDGEIRIYFHSDENNNAKLRVEDNGSGFPEDFDIEQSNSLGITLIKTLSKQLQGSWNYSSTPGEGTVFTLSFTVD